MRDISTQIVDDWIHNHLISLANDGKDFDIHHTMINLTLSIITKTSFEYDMSQSEGDEFIKELDILFREAMMWNAIPLRQRFGGIFISAVGRARLASKRLIALGLKMMESYRNNPNPTKGTVIDCIMKNPNYSDDEDRANDIISLVTAGHDTTGSTLAFILIELARNPDIQDEFQRKLKSTPVEDHGSLKELDNIIKEGMRLHPVTPSGSIRTTSCDRIVKKDGKADMLIAKGSTVFLSIIAVMRNPKYFSNPDKFIPSRWDDPSKESVSAFLPFSLGRRNCVGQSLARAQLVSVLPMLCSRFTFSVKEEGETDYFLTYKPVGTRLVATKV